MHARPTSKGRPSGAGARTTQCVVLSETDAKAAHERELARERQRKKRKLDNNGFERVTTRYSETVVEALFWQAVDAGLSEKEAIAASQDKAKVAEGLAGVHEQWAARYLKERDKA